MLSASLVIAHQYTTKREVRTLSTEEQTLNHLVFDLSGHLCGILLPGYLRFLLTNESSVSGATGFHRAASEGSTHLRNDCPTVENNGTASQHTNPLPEMKKNVIIC